VASYYLLAANVTRYKILTSKPYIVQYYWHFALPLLEGWHFCLAKLFWEVQKKFVSLSSVLLKVLFALPLLVSAIVRAGTRAQNHAIIFC